MKSSVKDHWERETCGTRYADADDRRTYFAQLSEARYRLEPLIPAFAGFRSAAGTRVLEIGVGAGADFENWCRYAERAEGVERKVSGADRRIRVRTETLARQFDRVLAVLEALDYVDGWTLSDKGRTLTRIYGEGDVLVAELVAAELLEGLEPSEVAALLSSVVYEGRERTPLTGPMPTDTTVARYDALRRTWRRVRRTEDEHQVQLCRELEQGFATPIWHWAEGRPLEEILAETDMAPGDFIRNCKQLLDLMRQIEEVAPPDTAALVRRARVSVARGVVAYTGV